MQENASQNELLRLGPRPDRAIITDMTYILREKVTVVMHLPEGYTKVRVERLPSIHWDIPTSVIPQHLRRMGSRFLAETTSLSGERAKDMTADEMRSAMNCLVHEIQDE